MDLVHLRRARKGIKMKELNSFGMGIMGLNRGALLIIRLPDSRILRIMSRSLFLAIFLLTLPSIRSVFRDGLNSIEKSDNGFDPSDLKLLQILFPDLVEEGLLKKGHKGLIVGSGVGENLETFEFWGKYGIELIPHVESNLDDNKSVPNESLDFVFGLNFKSIMPVDRVLKAGGIVITQLGNEPLGLLQRLPNYRIVYLRRFQNTMVAMRKVGSKENSNDPIKKLIPCGISQEARKLALTSLEDLLLEPPRRALKSKDKLWRFKFLPDLLGDSLESYPRRIFVSDEKSGVEDWFHNNYPTRNQYFEVYNLELNANKDVRIEKSSRNKGASEWLRNNVRREDFVVMKAEAQVVEEMMTENTICLVDELFLECKNQWQQKESKRAYWQCLALYGSLRDQGVAVHQWWS